MTDQSGNKKTYCQDESGNYEKMIRQYRCPFLHLHSHSHLSICFNFGQWNPIKPGLRHTFFTMAMKKRLLFQSLFRALQLSKAYFYSQYTKNASIHLVWCSSLLHTKQIHLENYARTCYCKEQSHVIVKYKSNKDITYPYLCRL